MSVTAEFKYISCSYLSRGLPLPSFNLTKFKYISCSYLSERPCRSCTCDCGIQIHLMFLFIYNGVHSASGNSDSNTSHVLIYPLIRNEILKEKEFKYISCSYLSIGLALDKYKALKFKYISCSYLS